MTPSLLFKWECMTTGVQLRQCHWRHKHLWQKRQKSTQPKQKAEKCKVLSKSALRKVAAAAAELESQACSSRAVLDPVEDPLMVKCPKCGDTLNLWQTRLNKQNKSSCGKCRTKSTKKTQVRVGGLICVLCSTKYRRNIRVDEEGKIATVPQEAAVRTDTRHEETGGTEMNQGSDSFDVLSMLNVSVFRIGLVK